MNRFVRMSAACLALAVCAGAAARADDLFTVGVISDTQNYVDDTKPQPESTAVYLQQMQYIADHKADKNMAFVTHVGDVVQHGDGTDGTSPVYGGPAEYDRAQQAMDILASAGIPFGMSPGNHDYDNYSYTTGSRPLSSVAMWPEYFGPDSDYFAGQSWYGGASNGLTVNPGLTSYQVFTAGGRMFLHISLEMEAGPAALAWAQAVVDAHPGLPTIVTTHEYLNPPADDNDSPPLAVPAVRIPASYLTGSPGGWSDAQGVWDQFIRVNDQIFLVVCGHASGPTHSGWSKSENIRIDNNDFGHPVYQVLTDFQNNTIDPEGGTTAPGGAGWMRFMEFNLTTNTIHFYTYSPLLDRYAGRDGDHTFNQDPAFSDFTLPIPPQAVPATDWIAVDFHQHTTYTDGSYPVGYMMAKNQEFGLGWWANSEHGGGFTRDGHFASADVYWDSYDPNPIIGDVEMSDGHQKMWRWQSIRDYSFVDIQEARTTYGKAIGQALEWNVPGHEHSSTGCIAGQFDAEPNASALAEFEYAFDNSDNDVTGGAAQGWTKSTLSGHAKAVAAAEWLQANYPFESWIVPAHPERKNMWDIAAFRDLNNAAPDVAFGFESMPGHQKGPDRGEYKPSSGTVGDTTYGGCGIYAAQIGGVWDALLGEGRNYWLFASSDFHSETNDFYPGEYQKTYVKVADAGSLQAIVDGLRSGNSFVVEGNLVDALEFDVDGRAEMGQHYSVAPGSDIVINIRVHSPSANLDHIDLIAGDVTGLIDPSDPAYGDGTNPSTAVIARFDSSTWTVEADGSCSMSYTLDDLAGAMYFRLRGSNLGLGVPNETDADGNPLSDGLMWPNDAEKAWADLWFYSNPVFVNVGFGIGDLNCDGLINAFDIDPFVIALTDPAGYAVAYPDCGVMLADCNGDGVVNSFDIDPFVTCLSAGGCR